MIELETERLLLRQWRDSDFDDYAGFYADAEMARYVGGHGNREQAFRRLASIIGHWTLRGYGYWAVEEKSTEALAGCVGLWFSPGWPELELGYWVMRAMQGKGYATEAGRRARDFAFQTLDAASLVSYVHPDNEPSKRVAERLGAHYDGVIELLEHGPHCIYRHVRD